MRVVVSAVIFDMDGVITDTMPYHFKVWKAIFSEQGIHLSHEDIYKREGQKGIDSVREIFAEYKKPFELGFAQGLLAEKERRFKKSFQRKFIRGSRSFIRQLDRQGYKLALVTGSARQEALKMLPEGLFNMFDVTVCGCDVQNGKPHPEPYLTALKMLSIKGKDAVVIENAPFGIRSAKSAGLKCLALATSLPASYLKQADGVYSSFNDLSSKVNFFKQ